jgi:SHS2 domain-containing protein
MTARHRQYEFIDHTADIIVRAGGATIAEAFAAAAEGMFDLITDSVRPAGQSLLQRTVRSIDIEGLLVAFLSELIVIHETDDVVLSDFDVTLDSDILLTFTARSEPFDPVRHGEGTPVKGVSYHQIEIGVDPVKKCPYVQVLLDI